MRTLSRWPASRWVSVVTILVTTIIAIGHDSCTAAQEPERALVSLVPSDAGLLVELQDLTGRSSWFGQSDLYRRLQQMAPFGQWQADLIPRVEQMSSSWSRELDMDANRVWTNIFGHEMVFAVWPKDAKEPGPGHGLLLLRAADRDLLLRVMQGLGTPQMRGNNVIEVQEVVLHGATFWKRVQHSESRSRTVYLAAAGDVGIVTSNESIMRRVLELWAEVPTGIESLAELPAYRQASRRWRPSAPMRLFVNPVAWDPWMIDALGDEGQTAPDAWLTVALRDIWRASQSWAASIEPGPPVIVDGYVQLDCDTLTDGVRVLLDSLRGESRFLESVPQDALIALGGRVDLARVSRLLDEREPEGNVQEVRDLLSGLLMGLDIFGGDTEKLGPDLGSYLVLDDSAADAAPDVEWVAGLRATVGDSDESTSQELFAHLEGNLRATLQTVADNFNTRHAGPAAEITDTADRDGRFITAVEAAGDSGECEMRAYTFSDDYLFAGTSSDIVRSTASLAPQSSLAQSSRYRKLLGPSLTEPGQVLYVDCARLRSALKEHPESLAEVLAAMQGFDQASLRRLVWQLSSILNVADTFVLATRVEDEGVAFTVGISEHPTNPDP